MEPSQYKHLVEHVLSPRRPRLWDALAVLRDCASSAEKRGDAQREGRLQVREYWETLGSREVIPLEWVASPQRFFRRSKKKYLPRYLWDALALASDPEGVGTAEQLARETLQRLSDWGGAPLPQGLFWRIFTQGAQRDGAVRASWPQQLLYLNAWQGAERAVTQRARRSVVNEANTQRARLRALAGAAQRSAVYACTEDCLSAWWWHKACELDLRVPPRSRTGFHPYEVPDALVDKRFVELPNPFDPLLALWQTGYALGGVGKLLEGTVELVAPALSVDEQQDFDGALQRWAR